MWNNQIWPDSTRNQSRIIQNLSVTVHFLFRIIETPTVARRVLWNRVFPSFRPYVFASVCPSVFLELHHYFSEFWHGAKNSFEVKRDRARFSRKTFLPEKLGKWSKNGPKQGFFNWLSNFVINFFWICSIMEIYIICCVPARIPYLIKCLFLWCGPKCSQSIRLQNFLISNISRTSQWNSLIFTCWYKFT